MLGWLSSFCCDGDQLHPVGWGGVREYWWPHNCHWGVLHKTNHLREIGRIQLATSVTRLDDLLDFGQLFKAFGNN